MQTKKWELKDGKITVPLGASFTCRLPMALTGNSITGECTTDKPGEAAVTKNVTLTRIKPAQADAELNKLLAAAQ